MHGFNLTTDTVIVLIFMVFIVLNHNHLLFNILMTIPTPLAIVTGIYISPEIVLWYKFIMLMYGIILVCYESHRLNRAINDGNHNELFIQPREMPFHWAWRMLTIFYFHYMRSPHFW